MFHTGAIAFVKTETERERKGMVSFHFLGEQDKRKRPAKERGTEKKSNWKRLMKFTLVTIKLAGFLAY